MQSELSCPKCGGQNFKRLDRRHVLIIHWLLNPGLCVNELILGQRIPKVTLICQECSEPSADRSYVPCRECGVLHLGRLWRKRLAFGHWFGLVCPTCGKVIPCIWNFWSLLILILTFPIWYFPARIARHHWLNFERHRVAAALGEPITPATDISWIRLGLFAWGGIMWGVFSVGLAILAIVERKWSLLWGIPAMIPLWTCGGLMWGWLMKTWMNRKP